MTTFETGMGGGNRGFATTLWTAVLKAGSPDSSERIEALERLIHAYWTPLYYFARRKGHSREDAKDLVQEFFSGLIEKDTLARADRERGRFRTYLRAAFTYFLADQWDKEQAQKRGGGRKPLSLSFASPDEEDRMLDPPDLLTSETLYDRDWARTMLGRAIDRLKEECARTGREVQFALLQKTLGGEAPSTEELAGQFGLTSQGVKTHLFRARRRLRDFMVAEVSDQVEDPGQVQDELETLRRALSG